MCVGHDSCCYTPGIDEKSCGYAALTDYTAGSPSGIAVGFFLAQHKHQLRGNKMISMITAFKARQPITDDEYPTLIFWVKDAPNLYGEIGGARLGNECGCDRCCRRFRGDKGIEKEREWMECV